jgi:non-ribosomal peptide synthetase component F
MLPFERETAVPSAKPSDGVIAWRIPLETSRRLDLIASRNKATYLAVRLAAFLATLAESTGQQDLLISCLSTGRTRIEWQNMFGMFANTVALRTNWNSKKSFVWWLRVVSKALIAVQEHAEIPYHLLCQTLADEGLAIPEINLQFSVTDLNVARSLGDLELSSSQRVIESLPWGFSMKLGQNPESDCYTSFDARLHDPERVRIFLNRYLHLLDTFAQNPKSRMSRSMQSAIADGLPFGDRTRDVKHRKAA